MFYELYLSTQAQTKNGPLLHVQITPTKLVQCRSCSRFFSEQSEQRQVHRMVLLAVDPQEIMQCTDSQGRNQEFTIGNHSINHSICIRRHNSSVKITGQRRRGEPRDQSRVKR